MQRVPAATAALLVILAVTACKPDYDTPEIPRDSLIQRMPIEGGG